MKKLKSIGKLFGMAVFICLLHPFDLTAQNWPVVNGSRERTSWASAESRLLPPLEKRMEFSLDGGIASGISCYDDILFVSVEAQPNRLVAFNTEDGSERWDFEIPGTRGSVNLTPAINDSLVFCGGSQGLGLYALDRLTGSVRWLKKVGSLYSNNPIIDSNRVYVVADSLYCMELKDSATVWSFPLSGSVSPALDNELLYIGGYRELFVLDKYTGAIAWQMDNSQKRFWSISVDDQFVYTYHYDSVVALVKQSGDVHWSWPIPDGKPPELSTGSIAVSDSFLCFPVWEDSAGKGRLYVLDKISGQYQWHHTFDSTGVYTPVLANGMVYVVNWKAGALWGFDLKTGDDVFFDDSEPYIKPVIVADGKLFAGTRGKVVSFENYGTGFFPVSEAGKDSPEIGKSWPNPFSTSTQFEIFTAHSDHLDISIHDLSGKKVKTIAEKEFQAGSHVLSWDGTNDGSRKVPPGLYVLKLTSRQYIRSRRLILVR